MPQSLLFQNTTTVQGQSASDKVAQTRGILDLGGAIDVVIWSLIYAYSGSGVRLWFETSATGDDGSWLNVGSVIAATATKPALVKVTFADASVPVSRYLRWVVYGSSGSFSLTFQSWVVARPG